LSTFAACLMHATRHEVGRARLCLCVSSWIAASIVFASSGANAFVCLPSAEAVRQRDSVAWPSWTLRAPGFEGTKCWYASSRAGAHDHRNLPSREPAAATISESPEPEPEVTGSATAFERVRTSTSNLDSSFEDRFSAVCPIAGPSVAGCTSSAAQMNRTTD
jgi:hypothetical protein